MNRMNKMNRLNKRRITKKKKVSGRKSATRKSSLKLEKIKEDAVIDVDKMFPEPGPTTKKVKPFVVNKNLENSVIDVDKMFEDPPIPPTSRFSKSFWKRKKESNTKSDSKKLKSNSVSAKSNKTKKNSKNENDKDTDASYNAKFKIKTMENVDIDKMYQKPQSYWKRKKESNTKSDSKKLTSNSVTTKSNKTKKNSKNKNDVDMDASYNLEARMKTTANPNIKKIHPEPPPPTPSVSAKSNKTKKNSKNKNDVDMDASYNLEARMKPTANPNINQIFPEPPPPSVSAKSTKTKKNTSTKVDDTDHNLEARMKTTANPNINQIIPEPDATYNDKIKIIPEPPPPTPSEFDDAYWLKVYDEYLSDVLFSEEREDKLKEKIMEKSFGERSYFLDLFEEIKGVLPEKKINEHEKWVNCLKKCFSQTHDNVKKEIGSTAYMLRVLTKSVVGDTFNNQIAFSFDDKGKLTDKGELTGKWKDDKKHFKMKIFRKDGSRKVCKGRLIMGFGPSASGKTRCASEVIKLMSSIDNEFPKFFMTVDGGVFRGESLVYKTIIKAVGEKGAYDGLTNLVSTGGGGIFESDIIKKAMKQYLKEQKENNKFVVSLYVPETLSKCLVQPTCYTSYNDYINITGDKDWIGLMIFQHKEHSDCPYKKDYKCKGTTKSGEEREITEGKKYSSSAGWLSYINGNYSINQAETYRFRIHNSGRGDGITIFEDLSPKKINIEDKKISEFFKDSNWQYVDGKVKYNSDCKKYSDECSSTK